MGVRHSCFGQSSPQRLPNDSDYDQRHCFWFNSKNEAKEKKQQRIEVQKVQVKKVETPTLEDWLLAEQPVQYNCNNGGEYYEFNRSSNRVYPSFRVENAESSMNEALLKGEEADGRGGEEDDVFTSSCMSQRRRSKKKVSFRFPEEADVFVIFSSDENSTN